MRIVSDTTAYIIYRQVDTSLVPIGTADAIGSKAALVKWIASQNGDAKTDVTYVVIAASRHHAYKPKITTSVTFA